MCTIHGNRCMLSVIIDKVPVNNLLDIATDNNDAKVAELLIGNGAEVTFGHIQTTAYAGYCNVLKVLLKSAGHLYLDGILTELRRFGNTQIVRLLESAGARMVVIRNEYPIIRRGSL